MDKQTYYTEWGVCFNAVCADILHSIQTKNKNWN